MERMSDALQEGSNSRASEFRNLSDEVFSSMADFQSIFSSTSDSAAAAIKDQFGDLLLVDESPSLQTAFKGKVDPRAANRDASEPRATDDGKDSPRVIDGGNTKTEIDRDGQVRRAIVVDDDGLRARELEIPKGNTPLDEVPEKPSAPQDRLVEVDNQRKSVQVFDKNNSSFESDEDGEFRRGFVVDDDGRRTREVTVD